MEHNHISGRRRTEVPSEMRKLGKDIKVRILPAEEAKKLNSGSVTSRKVTKNNTKKSVTWDRGVSSSLKNKPPAKLVSHQEEDLRSKAYNLSMNKKNLYSRTVSSSPQARNQHAIEVSGASMRHEGSNGPSREMNQDSGSLVSSGSMGCSLLEKELPLSKGAIMRHKGSNGPSREMNQDSGSLVSSGSMGCSLLEKELPLSKGVTLQPNNTRTVGQENNVNKIKYIVHRSPLNGPALIAIWKGNFQIPNLPFNTNVISYEGISAHPSAKVSHIAYKLSKQLPTVLHFTFHPQTYFLPETFQIHSPDRTDIALYFYPDKTDNLRVGNYVCLLKFLVRKDMMLKSCMGNANLLIFPSTTLKPDSRELDGSYFMWGVFCATKGNSSSIDAALRRHPSQGKLLKD